MLLKHVKELTFNLKFFGEWCYTILQTKVCFILYKELADLIIDEGIIFITAFAYAVQSFILLRNYIQNLLRYMRLIMLELW